MCNTNERTSCSFSAIDSPRDFGLAEIKAPYLESEELSDCFAQPQGIDGHSYLTTNVQRWLGGIARQLPRRFQIHQDVAADRAAYLLGVEGFALGDHIFLKRGADEYLDIVLRHELVHLAQAQLARQSGSVGFPERIEWEADLLAHSPSASPVQIGADPTRIYPFVWFVAIGIGVYVLLRPSVANAPGPRDRTYASPSMGQILGEAIALFAIPGGLSNWPDGWDSVSSGAWLFQVLPQP